MSEEKIYYLADWTYANGAEWIKGLNAIPTQNNSMFGIVKPKK